MINRSNPRLINNVYQLKEKTMKIMNINELKALNVTKVKGAVSGKKGLQVVLEEMAKTVAEHGDWTICDGILEHWTDQDVNLTHEAAAAVKWAVKYMGLSHDKDGFNGWTSAQFIKDNFKDGKANPYYKGITIAKPFEFNLDAEVAKLVSKANTAMKKAKAAEEGGKEATVTVNQEHLNILKHLDTAILTEAA